MDEMIREGGEEIPISKEDTISKKDLLERIKVLEKRIELPSFEDIKNELSIQLGGISKIEEVYIRKVLEVITKRKQQ